MPTILPVLFAMLCLALAGKAQEPPTTALGAVKLLPPDAAARIARIEAHDGQPAPERWHLLVHDPAAPAGLREYVIAGGEIVASRTVSQFADGLGPGEVFGALAQVDSDRVIRLAQQYAQANGAALATLDLELKKDGEHAAPLWRARCLDAAGRELGQLVLSATKGTVLSHDGFAADPKPERADKKQTAVVHAQPVMETKREEKKPERPRPKPREEARTRPPEEPAVPVRQAIPVEANPAPAADAPPAEGRPGFFRRAGGTVQKVFTGRDPAVR